MEKLLDRLRSDDGTATRSTILHSLQWMTFILITGLGGTSFTSAPNWAIQIISALLILVVVLYLIFFCYFAIKNPDQLRSEKYSIRKMELERGLIGDNIFGLKESDSSKVIEHESKVGTDQGESQ